MFKRMKGNEGGFSAVAAIVIAAVVIGGGAVLVSNNNNADSNATSTNATSSSEVSTGNEMDTYRCENGAEVVIDYNADGAASVTLPSGEVKSVTRAEAASDAGEQYVSADGSFVFSEVAEQATIKQDGQIVVDGCVQSSDDSEETASTDEANSGAEVDATSSTETEAGAEAGIEVNAEAGVEAAAGS